MSLTNQLTNATVNPNGFVLGRYRTRFLTQKAAIVFGAFVDPLKFRDGCLKCQKRLIRIVPNSYVFPH